MDIHSHLNQAQSDDDHDIIIKMMGMRLIVTPISIRLQLMMITVIMTMMMILWKKLIFTDILILILICRWFCYAMYLPYAFFRRYRLYVWFQKAIYLQCSLWKLGGNSEREHVFCLLWTAIKVCRKICSQCLQRCHRRTGGGKFETFLNKVILLKVYTHANGFRNIIWILLKRPLFHQYE